MTPPTVLVHKCSVHQVAHFTSAAFHERPAVNVRLDGQTVVITRRCICGADIDLALGPANDTKPHTAA